MLFDRFQPPGTIEHLHHERDPEPRLCPDCNQWKYKCTCPSIIVDVTAHVNKLTQLVEHSFGQDAIGFAIQTQALDLTFDFERDSRLIMEKYDELCDDYQQALQRELQLEQAAP